MNYESLKVGDDVILSDRRLGSRIVKITGETPKRLKINGKMFDKSSGREITSDIWHRSYLELCTPENVAIAHQEMERQRQKNVWYKIRDLPIPTHISSDRLNEILKELLQPA